MSFTAPELRRDEQLAAGLDEAEPQSLGYGFAEAPLGPVNRRSVEVAIAEFDCLDDGLLHGLGASERPDSRAEAKHWNGSVVATGQGRF